MTTVNHSNIFARNVPGSTEILRKATVGIAGCGGLGSNAAVALVRAGVGLYSACVAIAANMEANIAIELLVNGAN